MRAHTRKLHTKKSPYEPLREEEHSVSWRTTLAGVLEKYTEAGAVLRGLRLRENMTQVQMAEKIGITQANLSAMERGKRSIGKEMAKKFAAFFDIDYRVFL